MILGDWIEDSGWCSAIAEAETTSSGKAQSLSASYMFRSRYAHQVRAAFLHILVMMAYENYTKSIEVSSSFLYWKDQKEKECP